MPTIRDTKDWFENALRVTWTDAARGYINSQGDFYAQFMQMLPVELREDFRRWNDRYQNHHLAFIRFIEAIYGEAHNDCPRMTFQSIEWGRCYAHDDPLAWARDLEDFIDWYTGNEICTIGLPWWQTSPEPQHIEALIPLSEVDSSIVQ